MQQCTLKKNAGVQSNYANSRAVMQGGVAAPLDSLIWGELAGSLAFEEENALAEGVMVIMATADNCMEREEHEERNGSDAKISQGSC
jgi:hypothetical protein